MPFNTLAPAACDAACVHVSHIQVNSRYEFTECNCTNSDGFWYGVRRQQGQIHSAKRLAMGQEAKATLKLNKLPEVGSAKFAARGLHRSTRIHAWSDRALAVAMVRHPSQTRRELCEAYCRMSGRPAPGGRPPAVQCHAVPSHHLHECLAVGSHWQTPQG